MQAQRDFIETNCLQLLQALDGLVGLCSRHRDRQGRYYAVDDILGNAFDITGPLTECFYKGALINLHEVDLLVAEKRRQLFADVSNYLQKTDSDHIDAETVDTLMRSQCNMLAEIDD